MATGIAVSASVVATTVAEPSPPVMALDHADHDRGGHQRGGVGEPLELQALDERSTPHPRSQRQGDRHEAGQRAQTADRERHPDNGLGQLRERAGDVVEILAVALRRQQGHHSERGERNRGRPHDGVPAGRGQPAVGEHQGDRGRQMNSVGQARSWISAAHSAPGSASRSSSAVESAYGVAT